MLSKKTIIYQRRLTAIILPFKYEYKTIQSSFFASRISPTLAVNMFNFNLPMKDYVCTL